FRAVEIREAEPRFPPALLEGNLRANRGPRSRREDRLRRAFVGACPDGDRPVSFGKRVAPGGDSGIAVAGDRGAIDLGAGRDSAGGFLKWKHRSQCEASKKCGCLRNPCTWRSGCSTAFISVISP